MILINAVRDADAQSSYSDYYVEKYKKSSDYYPARTRQRHHYRDLDNPEAQHRLWVTSNCELHLSKYS